jgi:hypothetical protein
MSSGWDRANTSRTVAEERDPGAAKRVTRCPSRISPSHSWPTTYSMPPYLGGGIRIQGGASMAMFRAAPSSRDIQGQYPQRLSPNSPIGAETFSGGHDTGQDAAVAPLRASSSAVMRPIPATAPVITAPLPSRRRALASGRTRVTLTGLSQALRHESHCRRLP